MGTNIINMFSISIITITRVMQDMDIGISNFVYIVSIRFCRLSLVFIYIFDLYIYCTLVFPIVGGGI